MGKNESMFLPARFFLSFFLFQPVGPTKEKKTLSGSLSLSLTLRARIARSLSPAENIADV